MGTQLCPGTMKLQTSEHYHNTLGSKAADHRAVYCPKAARIMRFLSPSRMPFQFFRENWLLEGDGTRKSGEGQRLPKICWGKQILCS